MLFTSGSFVVLVLVTFALFYLPALRRWQTQVLIVSSLVFYGLNQVSYLALLATSIAINASTSHLAFFSRDLRKARFWVTIGVVANLTILGFFKYSGLLGHSLPEPMTRQGGPAHLLLQITLPVGISFFTFEGISLLVDAYKARNAATFFGTDLETERGGGRHLLSTTLFISFFPHLVAGPILKAHDFYPQIQPKLLRDVDWNFCFGKLVTGYFLKMVIADGLKEHTFWLQYPHFTHIATGELLMLLFGYSMQIFADFAGYSLIAIGVAGLYGYRLPENFMFPYISQSFSEFWRRWHISLSSWLREYLYFPLGGNRKGSVRTYVNLFVVMFLGGLWHGAAWSYAIWGSVHGLALAIERFCTRVPERKLNKSADPSAGPAQEEPVPLIWQAAKMLMVFTVVTLAWLLFKLPNFSHVIEYGRSLWFNRHRAIDRPRVINLVMLSLPVVAYHAAYLVKGKFQSVTLRDWLPRLAPLAYGTMLFLILVDAGSSGEFIYFQF